MHYRCSFTVLQSGNLVSLKFTGEGSLHCIMKHSVTVMVTLGYSLVVGVTVLVQEVVDGGVEVGWNLLDISDFPTSCMLLIRQQSLFNEQQ